MLIYLPDWSTVDLYVRLIHVKQLTYAYLFVWWSISRNLTGEIGGRVLDATRTQSTTVYTRFSDHEWFVHTSSTLYSVSPFWLLRCPICDHWMRLWDSISRKWYHEILVLQYASLVLGLDAVWSKQTLFFVALWNVISAIGVVTFYHTSRCGETLRWFDRPARNFNKCPCLISYPQVRHDTHAHYLPTTHIRLRVHCLVTLAFLNAMKSDILSAPRVTNLWLNFHRIASCRYLDISAGEPRNGGNVRHHLRRSRTCVQHVLQLLVCCASQCANLSTLHHSLWTTR